MSWIHTAWATRQKGLTSTQKFVLVMLAEYVDRKPPHVAWPSIELLAEDTELDESTVRRALAAIVETGLISRSRVRREDGTLGVYVYEFPAVEVADVRMPPGARPAGTTGHRSRAEQVIQTPEQDHPSGGTDDGEPPLTQTLVARYCEQLGAQPPARARARVGREVKLLLAEGYGLDVLVPALDRMAERRLDPSLLPTLVAEAMPRHREEVDGFLAFLDREER